MPVFTKPATTTKSTRKGTSIPTSSSATISRTKSIIETAETNVPSATIIADSSASIPKGISSFILIGSLVGVYYIV